MGQILAFLAAAIFRGLLAKGFGLELEAWIEASTRLPHFTCVALGMVVAVIVVEAITLAIDALVKHWHAERGKAGPGRPLPPS